MADGLLTSILGAIDRQKQATKAGLGLLVSDPMEFARNATARYFPTPEEVAQQRALEQSGGIAMNTPYMDKMFNLAQFQGSIKPTGLLTPNQKAMAEIRKIQSERTPTDLSWVNNPQTQGPENIFELYHGTSPQAAKAIEKSGFDIKKSADGTVWFTSNPNIGEVAASNKGAVVKRLLDKNKMKLGGWAETDKYSTNELINMGYDGLMLKDGDTVTYQIFNPEKLIKR